MKGAISVLLALAVGACGDRPEGEEMETEAGGEPPSTTVTADSAAGGIARSYAPELGVELAEMDRTETGLYTQVLEEGEGTIVEAGDTVTIHYTGWLPDGTKFDSSVDRGEPFTVAIGTGRVIDGWEQGVPGMRVGEKRRLVIPPDLAYGPEGRPPVIPPSATLIFDVEVLGVR